MGIFSFAKDDLWKATVANHLMILEQKIEETAEDINENLSAGFAGVVSDVRWTSPYEYVVDENFDLNALVMKVNRHYLQLALDQADGNKTLAAKLVGLSSGQVFLDRARRAGMFI